MQPRTNQVACVFTQQQSHRIKDSNFCRCMLSVPLAAADTALQGWELVQGLRGESAAGLARAAHITPRLKLERGHGPLPAAAAAPIKLKSILRKEGGQSAPDSAPRFAAGVEEHRWGCSSYPT